MAERVRNRTDNSGMLRRDEDGVLHVVALSGGHDSTILSILLKEREPRPYNYVCTPTGNELPDMFAHWNKLSALLGRRIIPITGGALETVIRRQGTLPNFRRRYCTRIIKIMPFRNFLKTQLAQGPVVAYVGLRADEPGRAGGAYEEIGDVTLRYPLREWGMDDPMVLAALAERGIVVPRRTDCALCYHQRIGEWYLLWRDHPDEYAAGEALEAEMQETFRTPGRDSWPSDLRAMRERFEAGDVPQTSLNRIIRETQQAGACRVCSL